MNGTLPQCGKNYLFHFIIVCWATFGWCSYALSQDDATVATVSELMLLIKGKDRKVAISAVVAMKKLGPDAVSIAGELVKSFGQGDQWKAWSSISILHSIGPGALPMLFQGLDEVNPTKQTLILMTIAGMKNSTIDIVPHILKSYWDSNKDVRSVTVSILKSQGKIGLINTAYDRKMWNHREALMKEWLAAMEKECQLAKTPEALCEIHKHMALTFKHIGETDLAIENWLSARKAIGIRKKNTLATRFDRPLLEIGKIYKERGDLDKAVEFFERFLGSEYGKNWANQAQLKRLQGEIREMLQLMKLQKGMPELAKMLGSENFELRQKAFRGFETLGKAAIPFLLKLKDHSDLEVQTAVRRLLVDAKARRP